MNRVAVRMTLAVLVVVAVTAVVQVSVIAYMIYAVLSGLPEASLNKLQTLFPESYQPNLGSVELYLLLGAEFMVVVVGVILALVVARRVTRPLEVVSQAASRVARGDLAARATLGRRTRRGGDETGMLVQNFNAMAGALEKLETERKATSAAIAHELRTPITILRGRLEAIRDGVVRLDDAEFGNLLAQTELMSRLVADLRTLSLADAGQLSLERHALDLRAIVGQAVSSFEARAASKGMRLEFVCAHDRLEAPVDPNRVVQVVGNLIENAVRYAPEGGFVRVTLDARAGQAVIVVRDSGEGVPQEQIGRIFDRFYRTDGSRSRFTGGTGLGLAIVKAIVELHGGSIGVRNHPEGGAEFEVRLPRTLETASFAPKRAWSLEWLKPVQGRVGMADLGAVGPGQDRTIPSAAPGAAEPAMYESSTFAHFLYLLLAFPLGFVYFVYLIVAFALSLPLSLLVIGLPLLVLTLASVGPMAALERWLNDLLLGVPIPFAPREQRGGTVTRLRALLRDPGVWKATAYLMLKFPFGLLCFVAGVTLVGVSGVFLVAPIIYAFDPTALQMDWLPGQNRPEATFVVSAVGAILAVFTVLLMNWTATAWGQFARFMLQQTPARAPEVQPGTRVEPEGRERIRLEL